MPTSAACAPLHPDLLDSHLMLQLAEAELHQGNEFVGLFDDEELLGFGGISFIHFEISAEPLPPGAVYLWDDFVCPAHRGRKIHNLLITLRCEIAAERGRNRALALVHTFNKASRKNFEEEGFRRFALWLRLERKFQCVLPGNGDAPSANIETSSCNRGKEGKEVKEPKTFFNRPNLQTAQTSQPF